jgi:hypothetical protein
MPQPPLRGKQVLTMDEVDERFPFLKYKNWVATRARGLSTYGGIVVNATPSLTASKREANTTVPTVPSSLADSEQTLSSESKCSLSAEVAPAEDIGRTADAGQKSMETSTADSKATSTIVEEHHILEEIHTTDSVNDKRKDEDESEDEDEHVRIVVTPGLVADPGDICTICIGTMDQEHNIRGLTCGHAFHVGCIDPWLTSRRACCPLCKTNYYVPKPVPTGEATQPERPGRVNLAGNPGDGLSYGPVESRRVMRARRAAAAAAVTGAAPNSASAQPSNAGAPRSWRPRIPNAFRAVHIPAILIPSRARGLGSAAEEHTESSPSQLEAGVVS